MERPDTLGKLTWRFIEVVLKDGTYVWRWRAVIDVETRTPEPPTIFVTQPGDTV